MRNRRRVLVASAAAATLAALLGSVPASSAGPNETPAGKTPATVPAGQVVIAAAGADATVEVASAFITGTNNYNIPTLPATPFAVPGDANCSDISYVTATPGPGQAIAPPSAGVGLNLLKAQETNAPGQKGCLDIARSSSAPRGLASDPATFEYYAFALDATSWASPSLSAPATLTKQTLKDIYNCTITDWSAVPGAGSGPIQRYFTQVGSGVGSFFQSDLLDGQDPFAVSNGSCPTPKRVQQSHGNFVDPADREKAILPYAVGSWIFQANNEVNPTLDLRGGSRLGGIDTGVARGNAAQWNSADGVYQLYTNGGPVTENNVKVNNPTPAYPGIRYLYNTIDTVSPNYAEAAALVAFSNVPVGAKSPLCSNTYASAILSFGQAPLSNTSGPNNLAGSTCRKFTN